MNSSNFGSAEREAFLRAWGGDAPPDAIPPSRDGGSYLAINLQDGGFNTYVHWPHQADAVSQCDEWAAQGLVSAVYANEGDRVHLALPEADQ